MKQKPANILLEKHLHELGLHFQKEVRFHAERKWRFDYVLLSEDEPNHISSLRIAIEIEGGLFIRGRHNRPLGFQRDLDKYNYATMMGWRVLRFSVQDVLRGRAKAFLQEWLENRSMGLESGKKGQSERQP